MVESGREDRAIEATEAANRAASMARIALIVAATALALAILGIFLPI